MPILPSGGAHWIEPYGASAPRVRNLVIRETSSGVFKFVNTGRADLEMVDVAGTGVFAPVPAGSFPSARRATARVLGGRNVLVV